MSRKVVFQDELNIREKKVAAFISGHGYGHAARSCAILEALYQIQPYHLSIYTDCNRHIFSQSLSFPFRYTSCLSDIGLVQESAFKANLPATLSRLEHFVESLHTPPIALLKEVSEHDLVYCDISPLGLSLAEQTGRPAVLVENFLWPWIYEPYWDDFPPLKSISSFFEHLYRSVPALHLSLTPFCTDYSSAKVVSPVSRTAHSTASDTKASLGLTEDKPVILISMGGFSGTYSFVESLYSLPYYFIITGQWTEETWLHNCRLLPHSSRFFHPDLMHIASVLVGKIGYSSLAEVLHHGTPFLYIPRLDFRESPALEQYLKNLNWPCSAISEAAFHELVWLTQLPHLVGKTVPLPLRPPQASAEAAERIASLLHGSIA